MQAESLPSSALEQSAFLATLPPDAFLAAKKGSGTGGESSGSPGQEEGLRLFHQWVLSTPCAMEAWLLTVRPADNVAKALAQWSSLAQGDPAAKEKYMNLALACALVFEEPKKVEWNGSQTITLTADQRYAYYTKHAAKGELALNPDKLTARDLVWTVAAPVPESELEWALKKVNLRQKTWGSVYEAIVYDMERAVKDTSKYDEYTFAEIEKKGGICGDRSYYTAYTARAAGIPAAIVTGDGSRGGHAWVTWLSEDNHWSFAGRYDGYPLGDVNNPQTGRNDSEQEFIRRSDRNASDEGLLRGMRAVWLAQAMEAEGAIDMAAAIYEGASVLGNNVPAMWKAKLAFWSAHRGEAPLDQWRAFLDLLKRQMKDDVDILGAARAAEEKFVFPRQDSKLAMKELKKDVRKLDRSDAAGNVDQADQIAKVLKQQAAVLEKSGLDAVRGLYDKSYREHGRNPAVFKLLAADCWSFVKGDAEVAKKACRDMESSFKRYIDSGGDYFDITSQTSVLSLISKCYREIGEEKKAESLAKDVEKANAKASRNAL
ncbi:MAG: transglutaminase domain-containing protein [Roseimicrobium sp.]